MEVTESKKIKYSYPFGLGAFLMNGCYQLTGLSSDQKSFDETGSSGDSSQQDASFSKKKKRRKRSLHENEQTSINKTDQFISFCSRFAQFEKTKECFVS